ncbi:MAG: anthranilate phosphoribosyltransferase, partial [Acidimicrobiales bacterium]
MTELSELGGWPWLLGRLMAGETLSVDEAGAALGDILAGDASAAQVAAFVTALRLRGETVEEMTGLVRAMAGHAERVSVEASVVDRLVDTCGTGGDRRHSINVSTIAAFVVAGAGVPVCKHGGRAAS